MKIKQERRKQLHSRKQIYIQNKAKAEVMKAKLMNMMIDLSIKREKQLISKDIVTLEGKGNGY